VRAQSGMHGLRACVACRVHVLVRALVRGGMRAWLGWCVQDACVRGRACVMHA
jgi:hypothetical protein